MGSWKIVANRYAWGARWLAALLTVIGLMLLARTLPMEDGVRAVEQWTDELGVWAPVALVAAYIVVAVFFIPAWPLTVGAGAVLGLLEGTLMVSVAATCGAAAAFLVARYVARHRIARYVGRSRKFAAIDEAIGQQGWKIVALLRLSPAVPFSLQNYLFGLTSIRFWPYVAVSWVSMLPGTFMYVYIGYLGGQALGAASGSQSATVGKWVMGIVGLAATCTVTIYVTVLARRAIHERTHLDDKEPDERAEGSQHTAPESAATWPWRSLLMLAGGIGVLVAAAWAYFATK